MPSSFEIQISQDVHMKVSEKCLFNSSGNTAILNLQHSEIFMENKIRVRVRKFSAHFVVLLIFK